MIPVKAEVLIAAGVSEAQQRDMIEAFAIAGIDADARVIPVHRGAGELQWLVLAALPLQAFLSGLGSAMAESVSQALNSIVRKISQTEHPATQSNRVLILQDTETRLQIVLEADLPSQAYDALMSLNLSKYRTGPLHYDQQRREWRSELDEWRQLEESRSDNSQAE